MPPSAIVTVAPARRIVGRLRVPGDKSVSHRYALLAALAEGRSTLRNFAPGADCRSTLACLGRLGVETSQGMDGSVTVLGRGIGRLSSPSATLDAGNSGTTMRLLAGIVAGHPFSSRLVGDRSLSGRPMRRVIEPLERMGAKIDATDGHPPLVVHGARLQGIVHRPEVPSAQVKSAVLLAGVHAAGTTTVVESAATRDHTERALLAFGGSVTVEGLAVSVSRAQRLVGRELSVPGDFSSAAFWLVAAAALPGSRVEIADVGLNPTRRGLLDVLRRFGANVLVEEAARVGTPDGGEPQGTITVEHQNVRPVVIAPEEVPGLIDELPAIAALGAHGGHVTVSGASELRVKETDRIAALVAGLRALGVNADERPDGFVIGGRAALAPGRPTLDGGAADARGDHRMAMAFAIAALGADTPSTIEGADAVVISYPDFFETLGRLTS
jgi:3-phosphoshikimate 1-carboxyvinyltransferase